MEAPVFVLGDIHGHLARMITLLQSAGLIDAEQRWIGGRARLWCLGDFFDRGPDGVGSVDLTMRLQREAAVAGGSVEALLGNHELLLLAAMRFGDELTSIPSMTFGALWLRNGGQPADIRRITPAQTEWICRRPAMALDGPLLLTHADATFYATYGESVDEVNAAVRDAMQSDDPMTWNNLLAQFSERMRFTETGGSSRAETFLNYFGGRVLVHGHTPIPYLTGQRPSEVTEPLRYAGGRCVNCDGGIYQGGPGFIWRVAL